MNPEVMAYEALKTERVTDKGKKEILQWFPLQEPKVVELSSKACQKNNHKTIFKEKLKDFI